jgi:3-oxoacyl-[acyl-carrier-protein] synthase-3
MFKMGIAGTGSYVPEKIITNEDLEKIMDTSNEWIMTRTGIAERRVTTEEEATSDLAYHASLSALHDAGLQPEDLDFILVATVTPDHPFPSVANQLQHRLGCRSILSLDVSAACAGFLAVVDIAEKYIRSGAYRHGLIIGADTLSKITDYTHRSSSILFGDGAGAWVVSREDRNSAKGLLYSTIQSDGEHFKSLYVPGGGSRYPNPETSGVKNKIYMDGRKIFKMAVQSMSSSILQTLAATNHNMDDIDWLVPHQANERIIDALARNLDFPNHKVIKTIKNYGNNSSATIPLAFDLSVRNGTLKRGHKIMLTSFGGGLIWGSAFMQY